LTRVWEQGSAFRPARPRRVAATMLSICRMTVRQAIKVCRRRKDTTTGRTSRQTTYAVTSLTSADATAQGLARLVREHWSIEAHHHAT